MQPPTNSANQSASGIFTPIHIHIVDEFNTDSSLDVAATLLASSHLASCSQIRISTSGLHPKLNAHPKIIAASNNNNNSSIKYGSTTFQELQELLGWDEQTLRKNELVSIRPRNFLTLDRKLLQSNTGRFDIVYCCSADVYEAVCQYYSTLSFSTSSSSSNNNNVPHSVFIVFIDSKFFKVRNSQESNNNHQPSQGTLFTSFVVEILDLIHLQSENSSSADVSIPQQVPNTAFGTSKWKEEFGKNVKQFEQFRKVEIMFKPFVV